MEKLHDGVNFENLIYHFKGSSKNIVFSKFIDAELFLMT